MKKILIFIFMSFLTCLIACQNPDNNSTENPPVVPETEEVIKEVENMKVAPRKSFKLLTIGDNYSKDSMEYVYQILNSFGVREVVVASLSVNDGSIENHVNYFANDDKVYSYRKNVNNVVATTNGYRISKALSDENWQYVSLQQTAELSGIDENYNQLINALNEYIRYDLNNKDLQIGWHMTWAYGKNASLEGFKNYNNDQITMYNNIVDCVENHFNADKNYDFIVPNATAIQNARTSYLAETLTSDGTNLEDLGKFIAGLTYVLEITNWPIEDMNTNLIPQKFMPYFDVIKESVLNALEKPYEITESKYLSDPIANMEKGPFEIKNNISYSDVSNSCKLDMYLPKKESFDTVIHFHGGGLNSGTKDDTAHVKMASTVAEAGIGFVSVNYRLYPEAKYPDFFTDGANAIKFVIDYLKTNNITGNVYISGQSAGAYLSMMLCFNKDYLTTAGVQMADIDGWIIEAGQPTTHFNILGEKGEDTQLQRVDKAAPLYYVDSNTRFSDMLLISYTNDIALRPEQNTLLYKTILNYNPNASVEFRIYEGAHCINSTTAYRNHYVHSNIIIDYVKNR